MSGGASGNMFRVRSHSYHHCRQQRGQVLHMHVLLTVTTPNVAASIMATDVWSHLLHAAGCFAIPRILSHHGFLV